MSLTTKILGGFLAMMILVGGYGWYRSFKSDAAYKKYKEQEAAFKHSMDDLQAKLTEQKAAWDVAEARAKGADARAALEREALQKELERYGAQGRAAEERVKKAGEQFETDKNTILNSTDTCQLCRDTCAERARISTEDFDVRCGEHVCDTACRQ